MQFAPLTNLAGRMPRLLARPSVCIGLALLILVAAGIAGFQRLYSSFAPYDDEGYVMISLRSYMNGHPLYDTTFSQYGPAYYVLNDAFHTVTGCPVTHDVARLKTLAIWLVAAILAAAIVFRLTGDRWVSLTALGAVYCHLDRLGLEPGHPQEVCLLALLGSLLVATLIVRDRAGCTSGWAIRSDGCDERQSERNTGVPLFALIALGLLTATAVMTKLNVGALLLLSLSLAMLLHAPPSRLRTGLLTCYVIAAIAGPFVLVGSHALTLDGPCLPWVVAAGVAAVVIISLGTHRATPAGPAMARSSSPTVRGVGNGSLFGGNESATCGMSPPGNVPKPFIASEQRPRSANLCISAWFTFVAIGSIGGFAYCLAAWWHGTSVAGLLEGLLLQHHRFGDQFFSRPPIFTVAVPAALLALALAVVRVRQQDMRPRFSLSLDRYVRLLATVIVIGASVRHATETFQALTDGATDRGLAGVIVSFATPFAWVMLLPVFAQQRTTNCRFGRTAIACVAVLQPLTAHPIPGTQMAIGSVALLIVLLVCFADWRSAVWQSLNERRAAPSVDDSDRDLAKGAVVFMLLLLAVTVSGRAIWNTHERSRLRPLDLPGARWLCLPADEVAEKRWLVAQLRERANTFVCLPNGYHSFHLWSELPPPTALNTTVWPRLFTDAQQQEVIAALERAERPCVVVDRQLLSTRGLQQPLVRYCLDEFEVAATQSRYELRSRASENHGQMMRPVGLESDVLIGQ